MELDPVPIGVDGAAEFFKGFLKLRQQGQGLHAVFGEPSGDEVEGETDDLAATETVLTRLRRALGNPEAQPAGFAGRGGFRGQWRGTVDWPVFEGRFQGEDIRYAGVDWGRAEWSGTLDTAAEAVVSHPLVLRKGEGEVTWTGRAEIGWFGQRDAIDGRARASAWPAEDLATFMEWDVEATGLLTGEAEVRGRRSAPEGEAKGQARGGRYYAVPFDEARVESRWKGRVAEVTRGEARVGGGSLAFRGRVTDDGIYDGSAEMEGVDLGAMAPAPAPGVALGGRLSGRLEMQGTLTRPRLRARLTSPMLRVDGASRDSRSLRVTAIRKGGGQWQRS